MEILHFEDLGDMSVVWLRTQLFSCGQNCLINDLGSEISYIL